MTTTFVWTVTSMSTLPSPTPDYVVNVQYRVTTRATIDKNAADEAVAQQQAKNNRIAAGLGVVQDKQGNAINQIEGGGINALGYATTISTPINQSIENKNAIAQQYKDLIATDKIKGEIDPNTGKVLTTSGTASGVGDKVKIVESDATQFYTRDASGTAKDVADYKEIVKQYANS